MHRVLVVVLSLLLPLPSVAQTVFVAPALSGGSSAAAASATAIPSFVGAAFVSPTALALPASLAFPSIPLLPSAAAAVVPTAVLTTPAAFPVTPAFARPAVAALSAASEENPSDETHGRNVFDGTNSILGEKGAVFVPIVRVERPGGSKALRIVRLWGGPPTEPRPVPGTDGQSGRELLATISRIASQGHKQHEYGDASNYLFSKADNVLVGGVRGVVDAYSGVFVPGTSSEGSDYPEPGDRNGDGHQDRKGMNVEHVFPQSYFDRRLPMRSDLHHLFATFMHPNSERGNLPFGVVTGKPDYSNSAGAKMGGGHFEPPDFTKGRVARAMLYFLARYRDSGVFTRSTTSFWNGQIETLLKWNRQFPPDADELNRNGLIEAFQGNRNPFVDDSGLADRVGAAAFRVSAPGR